MTWTRVCVAAVDLQTLTMVRLLRKQTKNWSIDLVSEGLRPGRIIRGRINPLQPALGFPNETEDMLLAAGFEIRDDAISGGDLYSCLVTRVDGCVEDIFNGNLCAKRYVIDGTICPSLGSVLVDSSSMCLVAAAPDKQRLRFKETAGAEYDLPVTDLRVLSDPAASRLCMAAAKAKKEWPLLRIGLARGFDGFGKFAPKRCYVQVNGIVFPS
jgi:hypothetical protein